MSPAHASSSKRSPEYYRLHTYENKGPDRREVRAYLDRLAIVRPGDGKPVSKAELNAYFSNMREARARLRADREKRAAATAS